MSDSHDPVRVLAEAKELVCIDPSTDPSTARLKDEVRKLCWQLLGPPSEGDAGRHAGSCG